MFTFKKMAISSTFYCAGLVALFAACKSSSEDTDTTEPTTFDTDMETTTTTDPSTTSETETDTDTDTTGEPSISEVRVVHVAADAPSVDVYVNGSLAFSDIDYGEATPYAELPEGSYTIDIYAAGADPQNNPPVVSFADMAIPGNETITVAAIGSLSDENSEEFRLLPLIEDFADPGVGNAAVRIIHAGPDAPAVDIDFGNDGSTELTNLAFSNDSGAAGVPLPAGIQLQIGIVANGATVTAFTSIELPEAANLFVFASGFLDEHPRNTEGFQLLAVAPSGTVGFIKQNPSVWSLHGIPGAPKVDVFVGDTQIIDDLEFAELSSQLQVSPGNYILEIFPAEPGNVKPVDPPLAALNTGDLLAGERYLGLVLQDVSGIQFPTYRDVFAPDELNHRINVIHGSADPGAADAKVGVINSAQDPTFAATLIEGLNFKDESNENVAEGIVVPPAVYNLGIAAPSNKVAADFTFIDTDLSQLSPTHFFVVALGTYDQEPTGFRLKAIPANGPLAWSNSIPVFFPTN